MPHRKASRSAKYRALHSFGCRGHQMRRTENRKLPVQQMPSASAFRSESAWLSPDSNRRCSAIGPRQTFRDRGLRRATQQGTLEVGQPGPSDDPACRVSPFRSASGYITSRAECIQVAESTEDLCAAAHHPGDGRSSLFQGNPSPGRSGREDPKSVHSDGGSVWRLRGIADPWDLSFHWRRAIGVLGGRMRGEAATSERSGDADLKVRRPCRCAPRVRAPTRDHAA